MQKIAAAFFLSLVSSGAIAAGTPGAFLSLIGLALGWFLLAAFALAASSAKSVKVTVATTTISGALIAIALGQVPYLAHEVLLNSVAWGALVVGAIIDFVAVRRVRSREGVNQLDVRD